MQMNHLLHSLSRIGLLAALVLAPTTQPLADAHAAPQAVGPCDLYSYRKIGTITGTVRDGAGQPLAGVAVTAYATTGEALPAGTTDAAGKYGDAQLPAGLYRLEFTPPPGPLQVVWYKDTTTPRAATFVEVKGGATTGNIDMTLPKGAQFNVTLRDPAGNPVPQSLVTVFDRYGHQLTGGRTDAAGRLLTTPGLPLGSYRLHTQPPYDSPLLATYYNGHGSLDAAEPITLTQAGSVDVPMTLQRGATLSGTVTDASGTPLAGASVRVRDAQSEADEPGVARYTQTDAQGRYSVEGIPSGSYRVEFSPNTIQPGAPASLRRMVTLDAPNLQANFDAALPSGGTITGRVTAPDGAPLRDAAVTVLDDGIISINRFTASDGGYAIHGLASGRYTLVFTHDTHQVLTLTEQVAVTAPTTTTLATTVLTPGSAISGKVTDPDGKPVANTFVSILDAATRKTIITTAPTNAEGFYTTTATLPSGSYIVKFQPPSSDRSCHLAVEYSGGAASAAAASVVQVSAPSTPSTVDAQLDYGTLITGHLSDGASGLPLSGEVLVYDAKGALVVAGRTSYLGYYRSGAGLLPGSYRVKFVAPGYVPLFFGGTTSLEAAAPVPSGANDVDIALPRGGTLRGRITAADTGAPLEHAAVTLYGANGRALAAQLTGFDGSYRFAGSLPSGQYRIGVAPGKQGDGTPYFTGYEAVFSGGAGSLDKAQPISLTAPKTLSADLLMPLTGAPAPTPPTTTPTTTPTVPPGQSPGKQLYLPLLQR